MSAIEKPPTTGPGFWLAAVVLVWMILFNIRPIRDPDIWWHLASGRYMAAQKIVPKTDVFSLTARGSPWVDTYWLQELVAYGVYRAGGLKALTLINSLVIALLVFLIGCVNPLRRLSWEAALIGTVWIFLAGHPRGYGWGEKTSLVTLGFLALLFYTLRSKSRGFSSPLLRAWPFLFMVWANMHRGFILGLVIFGIFVVEEWLKNYRSGLQLGRWWAVCAIATLANPYGFHVFGMGWQDLSLSPHNVTGWAQTPFSHLELYWLTLVLFWTAVAWTLRNRSSAKIGFLSTSLLLSALSVRYASLYPYFLIWAIPWLLSLWNQNMTNLRDTKAALLILTMMGIASIHIKPAFGINRRIFPVEAVEFLKNNALRVPFYHEYEFGGFFLWSLESMPPVLIDGRYPAVQGYQSLFPEIQKASEGTPDDFHRFLRRLDIHCAVVKYPSTQFLPAPFAVYFPRKEWALIYWDDRVLIFVRRIPLFKEAINKFEFQSVQPDSDPGYWLKTEWARASPQDQIRIRNEFVRNVQGHPTSRKARLWLDLTNPKALS